MKRVKSSARDSSKAKKSSSPPMEENQGPVEQVNMEEEVTTDWGAIQKRMLQNCVLGQMGLSNLKTQADAEYDGITDVSEDIPTEEEVETDMNSTIEAWEEYVRSVPIQQALKVNLQNFMRDLISSSLTIQAQDDPIGMSYTILSINSGDLTHDWDELFEAEPTRINQLTACLVFASIFIPAMVVKSYKIFSVQNILALVSAPNITVEWNARVNGKLRHTKLIVPKGEIQYMDQKASHLKKGSMDWWMQLFKPMTVKMESTDIKFQAKQGKFWANNKTIQTQSPELIAKTIVETQVLLYFYAKTVLSQKQKLWACLQSQMKGSTLFAPNSMQTKFGHTSTSPEFWYFRSR